MVTKVYMHALLTSEKPSIRCYMMDFCTSLYAISTSSVRLGRKKNAIFSIRQEVYAKATSYISPLLFNLYLNDLAFSFNKILSDPFVLPNGMKLNSLSYADDLIILSRSKVGLQNCVNTFSSYFNYLMLKMNPKKTRNIFFPKLRKKK